MVPDDNAVRAVDQNAPATPLSGALPSGVDWCDRLPGLRVSVPRARGVLRAVLDLAGLPHCPRADDAELVTSELVTNAIRHTPSGHEGRSFVLRIRVRSGWLRLEVGDRGRAEWRHREISRAGDDEESGRGLLIVTALADRAGHYPGDRGHICWAELTWPA